VDNPVSFHLTNGTHTGTGAVQPEGGEGGDKQPARSARVFVRKKEKLRLKGYTWHPLRVLPVRYDMFHDMSV
jgi:hypothetical protein